MSYTLSISINLGSRNSGLTLSGQLVDTSGVDVGSLVTTGFIEISGGNYLLTLSIPDSFRGGLKVLNGATLMAFTSINPQEAEFTDVKTSSISSVGSGAIAFTYTVTDGTNPLSGVKVNVSTDDLQENIVASSYTNDSGEVVFYLSAGTYYFWTYKSGYTFVNPDTEVIS